MAIKRSKEINSNDYLSLDDKNDVGIIDTRKLHNDALCGCGTIRPLFLQHFARPVVFIANAGLICALYLCGLTYFNGILTTIEKQFQLSSSEVAALSVLNDAMSLSLVIFVTYYGQKSHRPRWIATGGILISISYIFCALPHFLSEPIDTEHLLASGIGSADQDSTETTGVCMITSNPESQSTHMYGNYSSKNFSDSCAKEFNKKGMGPVKWLVVGQIIMGWGGSPMFPLITSYIDDAVKSHLFTSYTGK